jgi:hypothetical protein
MSKQATGRVVPIAGGRALVLERTFNAPVEDVWGERHRRASGSSGGSAAGRASPAAHRRS